MKKIMLFIAAMFFVLCIIPTPTTQAIPRQAQRDDTFASGLPNAAISVFNQREISGTVIELSNPAFKENGLTGGIQDQRGTTIAQSGTSTTTTTTGKTNPHVKRSGHGRSKMGDAAVKDDNNKNKGGGDEEDGEMEENEETEDDSAVKYNKDLKNTSGYNKDL
jgi:hypothetical protein